MTSWRTHEDMWNCNDGVMAILAVGLGFGAPQDIPVAEPTATGRVITAWPSFALIASYELLMGQVRRAARPAHPGSGPARPATGQDARHWPAGPVLSGLVLRYGRRGAAGEAQVLAIMRREICR